MDSETLEEAPTPHAGDGGSGGEEPVTPVEEASVEGKVEGGEKKKRGRKRKTAVEEGAEKKQAQRKRRSATGEPATPVERPSRERKAVDRFIQMSPRKVSASKVLTIEQGPGTKLKDIPNVNFKLSKRKADENLQVLHTILFGRKSNAHFLKRNIFQFSGFVWSENEEKHRSRIKEKIDKCTKDRLLDFSELLDIQILRATNKKEEISEKLLDFLQSPHATRDALLAEKEKKGKRKRRTKGVSQATTEAPLAKSTEKHKSTPETESKRGRKQSSKTKKEDEASLAENKDEDAHASAESEDLDDGGSTDKEGKDDIENINGDSEESDQVISEEEDDEDEIEESTPSRKQPDKKQKASVEKSRQKTAPLQKGTTTKSGKIPKNSVSKKTSSTLQPESSAQLESNKDPSKGPSSSKVISKEKASPVRSSRKTSKIAGDSSSRKSNADISASSPRSSKSKKENKKDHNNENQTIMEKSSGKKQGAKGPIKGQGKRKSAGDAKVEPSTEELHSVVSDLLKEVDFNTATLADILKQLGAHFNADLMDRKVEVKRLIEDVIKNMTDDEEDAEDAEEVDAKEESDEESD